MVMLCFPGFLLCLFFWVSLVMVDGRLYLIMIMPCFGVFTLLSDVVVAVMGVKESYHNGVDGRHPAPVTIGRLSIPRLGTWLCHHPSGGASPHFSTQTLDYCLGTELHPHSHLVDSLPADIRDFIWEPHRTLSTNLWNNYGQLRFCFWLS